LHTISLVLLGVTPYITASIIMQLATVLFPRVKEMYQEEGEAGRARFISIAATSLFLSLSAGSRLPYASFARRHLAAAYALPVRR
jgi:preprotein translocase subunit SecY